MYARHQRGALLNAALQQRAALTNGQHRPEGNGRRQPALFGADGAGDDDVDGTDAAFAREGDITEIYLDIAVTALEGNHYALAELQGTGKSWGSINGIIANALPANVQDAGDLAHTLTPKAMERMFGRQGEGWHTFKHPDSGKTMIRIGPRTDGH